MGFVDRIAEKVTVLAEGSVLAEGTLAQVQADERVIEGILGGKALPLPASPAPSRGRPRWPGGARSMGSAGFSSARIHHDDNFEMTCHAHR